MRQLEILTKMNDDGMILSSYYPDRLFPSGLLSLISTGEDEEEYFLKPFQLESLERNGLVRHFRSMNLKNNQYKITETGKERVKKERAIRKAFSFKKNKAS